MKKRFVLIDAHSIIFRSYFAFIKNPLRNSKGENTSGIYGFLNTLKKIKKQIPSEYICLAFDAPGKTFRDELYEEYKATRPPAPADIPFQVEKVKEIAKYLGIPSFEVEGYEADDILATLARRLQQKGEVYIVSSDKDLLQLVGNNVFVYDAYRESVYDQNAVMKKYGVPPRRIAEYLVLVGDSIDNVPGVPGIGPKRASAILKKYPDFESAIAEDNRLTPYKKQIALAKNLVFLKTDVPLQLNLEDMRIREPNLERLIPILLDLEFHSYVRELKKGTPGNRQLRIVDYSPGQTLGSVFGIAQEGDFIYLAEGEDTVYKARIDDVKNILFDKNHIKVGYHIKEILKNIEIKDNLFDILIVAWLLEPNRRSYSAQDIGLHYLNRVFKNNPVDIAQLSVLVYPELNKALSDTGMAELYQKIEAPLIPVLARMENRGIRVDLAYFEELNKEFKKEMIKFEKKIFELAGHNFNINSPKQLSHILFDELKLKPGKKRKTHYATDFETLKQLSKEHPLPEYLLQYRELAKIRSTYITPMIQLAQKGRIHTTFNQTATATGRLSSSNPNLQNIPIRSAWGRRIRKGFIAEPGFVLVSADYSQIELRILAHISGDKNLIESFKNNKDIHRYTASLIFKVAEDEVDDNQRRVAKVVNYGLIYGMSDYGLAQSLDISPEEAQQFIESYYILYPDVERWRRNAISLVQKNGYTETLFGRRRQFSDINSRNHRYRESSERAAINTPIQGTAADLIKIAMINVEDKLQRHNFTRGLLLSIHDELVFEIEEERIDEAREIITEAMEGVGDFRVPIRVSIGIGKNWDEAH